MIIHNPIVSGSLTFAANATLTSAQSTITGSFKGDVLSTNGLISSSAQVTSLLPANVVSGSSQVNADSITNFDSNVLDYMNAVGIISSSDQVNADTILQFDANVENVLNATGVISGSSQVVAINTTGFVNSVIDVLDGATVLSGSDQLTSSFDSRYVNSTGDESIAGNKTFSNNVTVIGNLTVSGTTTTTSTNTVIVGDNILDLNYGGGATDGGLYITDVTGGGLSTGSLLWSGDDDRWKAGTINNESNVLLAHGDGIISSSEQLTNSLLRINGDSVVSGSSQISASQTTGWSDDVKTALDINTVISGSSQLTNVFLQKDGDGVISSSAQITITESQISDLVHYTDSDTLAYINSQGVISGSSQVSLSGFSTDDVSEGSTNLYYTDTRVQNKINQDNLVSSSAQINGTQITNNTITIAGVVTSLGDSITAATILSGTGTISGSSQLTNVATDFGTGRVSANNIGNVDGSTTFTGSFVGDGTQLSGVTSYTDADTLEYINTLGVVSSSAQITITESQISDLDHYTDSDVKTKLNTENVHSGSFLGTATTTNLTEGTNLYFTDARVKTKLNAEGVFSSSAQLSADFLDTLGDGVVSSSAQISNYGVFAELNGDGLISSSAQLTDVFLSKDGNGVISSSAQLTTEFDSRYINTNGDGVVSGSSQINLANVTGNTTSNVTEGTNLYYTDARVKTKLNTENVISSSAQLVNTFLEINGDGVHSGSAQVVSSLVSSTSISGGDKSTIQLNLGVDPSGTDNSTDVTLDGSYDYITITGQTITRNQIDASTDISNLTTTNVAEASNLYYTDGRVLTYINSLGVQSGSDTPHYTDSDTLVYINSLGVHSGSFLGSATTTNLSEGTNLYFTDARVKTKLNAEGVISSSAQITITESQISDLNHYTDSDVKTKLNAEGVISGSSQVLGGTGILSSSAQVDHDQTTNFVANEHIDHSTVTMTAGNGLTGGGTIAATRTFHVGQGDGISVSTDTVAVDGTVLRTTGFGIISSSVQVDHDQTTNFVAGEHFLQSAITQVGTVTQGSVTAILPSGTISGSSQINHDSTTGFVSNEHIDHSTVTMTAGNGLTGGGTIAATRTFHVGQGDGISVSTDTVAVDGTVVRTTGNQTISGTKTFNDIIVNGTGSFAYITSTAGSAKIIGDSFIILNNDTPTSRYAGISVQDSGSANVTASLFFDGQLNDWSYEYNDNGTVDYGSIIFGPEYSTKGTPTYPTSNTIQKGLGGHHIGDSNITDNGTLITLGSNSKVTGTFVASGTTLVSSSAQISYASISGIPTIAFTLSGDTGTNQTISNGNTLKIAGGTGVSTVAGATDTVTISIGQDVATNATPTFGTITVNGDVIPGTDNTGNVGTTGNTWSNGVFTNMTIDSTLSVRGAIDLADSDVLRFGSSDDAYFVYNGTSNFLELQLEAAATDFRITDNGTNKFVFTKSTGDFTATGDVVAYSSSDKRLKDNIKNIENPIQKVQALNGVTWDWNELASDAAKQSPNVGVIAQEVEEVLPQLVHDRDNGFKGVDYAKLTGLLIEAIKEQQKQIDYLKSKIG